jgi:LCP family protein required for cell wall assembly
VELPRRRRAGAGGAGGPSGAANLRRTWPQRLLIVFNSCLVVVCLSSAWALSFYDTQLASIPRVPLQGVLDPLVDPSKPVNFLLVGTDTNFEADQATANEGRQGVFHADSISILRVDPTKKEAALLSLPRDLWVPIPGLAGVHKISEALTYANPPGDPELLIRTIREHLKIPVNNFVQVDFAAFRSLVDELDGVNLWFDKPARDEKIGLFVDEAGCRRANGEEALAFARSRYYQERQEDGSWPFDPTSDRGRIARQQYFLKQAAKKAIAKGARNPLVLTNLIGVAQRYVKVDDALTPQMILDVVGHFTTFNPDDLEVVQPYTDRYVRPGPGGDGLNLREEPSQPIFDLFRDQPLAPPAPAATTPGTTAGGVPPAMAATETTLAAPDAGAFVPNPPPDAAC